MEDEIASVMWRKYISYKRKPSRIEIWIKIMFKKLKAMKTIIILLNFIAIIILAFMMNSCAVVDRLEESHYNLYNNTKALYVMGEDKGKLVLESFTKQSVYTLKSKDWQIGDTIILRDNQDIFGQLQFTRFSNLNYCPERGFSTNGTEVYTLKELKKHFKSKFYGRN